MSQNTNTQVVVKQERASALATMAQRFNVEPQKLLTTLKNTVFKNASDDELMALVIVANEYNLNPLKKEIYAFPAKGGGIVPVVGVDGWINIMNSHPHYDGIEFKPEADEHGKPLACTAIIHIKGRSHPVAVTEYFEECKRNTDPWNSMPRRMLRNRALAQCVRIAFTAGGIMDEDEASAMIDPVQAAKPVQATVSEPNQPTKPTRANASANKTGPAKKDMVGQWMTEKQYTWGQIQPILASESVFDGADSISSFDEVTEDQAASIWGARTGLEFALGTNGGGK